MFARHLCYIEQQHDNMSFILINLRERCERRDDLGHGLAIPYDRVGAPFR